MDKEVARIILNTFINCPCVKEEKECEKDEDEYCECGCWSVAEMQEVIDTLFGK